MAENVYDFASDLIYDGGNIVVAKKLIRYDVDLFLASEAQYDDISDHGRLPGNLRELE